MTNDFGAVRRALARRCLFHFSSSKGSGPLLQARASSGRRGSADGASSRRTPIRLQGPKGR